MKKYKLGDIAKTGSGGTPTSTIVEYYEGGTIPWINSGELNNPFITSTRNFITQKGYDNSSTKLFPPKTVLLAMYGATAGKASLLEFEACTNQAVCAIMPNEKILSPIWLKYKLDSIYSYLVGLSTGSARDNLSQDGIKALEIEIPGLEEQNKVASVLYSLDSKISNNSAICAQLEAMVKLLYDYWFTQFDFPDKNGNPYRSSGGAMVWNEQLKKSIPNGWKTQPLSFYISKYKNGDWGNAEKKQEDDIQVTCFRGADFKSITDDYKVTAPVRFISSKNTDRLLADGDIVVEISGGSPSQSTGRIGYINNIFLKRNGDKMSCSNFCKAITLKKKTYQYWFYQTWSTLYDAGAMFNFEGKTTGIKNLMFDEFISSIIFPAPPNDLLERFQTICALYYDAVQKILIESDKLDSLKNWLLPMLMNGQATISD